MSNAAAIRPGRPALPEWVRRLPEYLMIWVPLLLSAAHLVSFSLWTIWISLTPSTLIPVSGWVGLRNYTAVLASRNWQIAFDNLLLFGIAFEGHDTAPLLLPASFEGHPLRKDFVLAAREARPWPGAKDPGESDADLATPKRRRAKPLGAR